MKISICIEALFNGQDFVDSMEKISAIGIRNYEFWTWWDKDLKAIKDANEKFGLNTVAFCTKFISLVDPYKREEYIAGLRESIEAASFLGCKRLITQVGNNNGYSRKIQHKSIVDGLKACVPMLEEAGIVLLVEPLNTYVDHPGYYLSSSFEGFEIIDEVGSPNVRLLFDIYHQQIMEGNIIRNFTANVDKIGHFHAAGNPGRHELYFGEINYREVFKAIDESGYNGFIGFEYFPLEDPLKGIKASMG